MPQLRLRLLGGFEAQVGSEPTLRLPTRKAEALLAYLALSAGQANQRDKLAALLWGDASDEKARGSLRRAIAGIRTALGERARSTLATAGHTLALNPSAVDVDVEEFERRVAEGTPEALEQAMALYRGDLLEGLNLNEPPFEEWLLSERERLRELAVEALARLLAHQSRDEQTERAIQTALRLLTLDPFLEPAHRTLMRLYARQGRWAAALQQYQTCVGILERELGAEPEAETKKVYREIIQQHSLPSAAAGTPVLPTRRRRRPDAIAPLADVFAARPPLIGRKTELARLRGILDEACRGHGQVAAVIGEAGIGKSRLVEELADAGLRRGCRVLFGRAHEIEQALPFGPWVDAFRAGQLSSDEHVLRGLAPVWRAELARLFPEWRTPASQYPTSGEDHLRLFEAVAQLLGHLASQRPVAMMLEDLQWADAMSLRLLSFLGHRIQAWPALMIATGREEEIADTPLLGRLLGELDRGPAVRLTLSPLSREDTDALVRALARTGRRADALSRLGEQIWAISEGNPFMVIEVARGILAGTVSETSSALRMPERVREVVARRLDRLSNVGRKLVSVAAAIGREFEFAVLQRAGGLPERAAAAGVEELVRRRVLRGAGERFDFTHDRIREVAYQRLLPARRCLLHGAVLEAIEQVHAGDLEPHCAVLGAHGWEAGLWSKAATYLHRAGEQARRRAAYREAVAFFERALLALERLPESRETSEQAIDLRFDLRNALAPLGEFERIGDELAKAEAVAETLGDRHRLAWVSVHMTHHFRIRGDLRRAVASGERALSTATALDDFVLTGGASLDLAASCYALGDYRRAVDLLTRLVPCLDGDLIRERFGTSAATSVMSRFYLAWCLSEQGEFARGLEQASEALRIAEAIGNPYELAAAQQAAGDVLLRKGDLPEAIARLEQGLAFCRSAEIPLYYRGFAAALGYAYALSRRPSQAVPLLEGALEQDLKMGIVYNRSLHISWLGEAHLLAGRTEPAIELARRALDLSRQHETRGFQAWSLRLLGEVRAAARPLDPVATDTPYREALALAEELGMRPLVAHCHLGLGKLYRKTGKRHQAREHLTVAATLFGAIDMRFWLERADAELAEVR